VPGKLVVRFDPDQHRLRESTSGLAAPFDQDDRQIENRREKQDFYLWLK
jgi:hypothetical protein